ncbi:hypothetical protein C7H79_15225 [Nitrosomonas supralitoralis]|uniref:HTH cro/C1-type domain-containing protein n=1 Tax=Nitrosomonas supralitoralis TaxID=2116706 RepID=A0A2P7NRN4_9PROT|nr:helix-turn-helix domain-containing protein [Nitrosomonas supralitoralis]PSJ16122.1 hypothetical protein C7H79_15225 [Nitrosomonas supralitoralis]
MNHYKQLTREQRYQISGLKKAGLNQSQIADEVGVHKSTISREFRRNKGRRGWHPKQAQELRDERRGTIKNRIGIDERPVIVEQKSRIGDWECDTVIGKNYRRIGDIGRKEVALHSGSPSFRQSCVGCDSGSNAATTPPQRQVLHHDIRQRERVCGASNHLGGTRCGCLFRPSLPFMGAWLE